MKWCIVYQCNFSGVITQSFLIANSYNEYLILKNIIKDIKFAILTSTWKIKLKK